MITNLKSVYNNNSSLNIKSKNENTSLFVESLNILQENNRTLNSLLSDIIKPTIATESSTESYIEEGTIKKILSNIIELFINLIEGIFRKFKSLYITFTYSDKTIDKYESRIRNIKKPFNVPFVRYNYTCTDIDIPKINLKTEVYPIYDDLFDQLDKSLSKCSSNVELVHRLTRIEGDIRNDLYNSTEVKYDKVRANCLNSDLKYIKKDQFSDFLFNKFRDGGYEANTKVNYMDIGCAIDEYRKAKDYLKDVEKLKDETVRQAREVGRKISNITIDQFDKGYDKGSRDKDLEAEDIFNRILKFKTGEVNEICNIYAMAYSARLDAIKDMESQNKRIIYCVIQWIVSGADDI